MQHPFRGDVSLLYPAEEFGKTRSFEGTVRINSLLPALGVSFVAVNTHGIVEVGAISNIDGSFALRGLKDHTDMMLITDPLHGPTDRGNIIGEQFVPQLSPLTIFRTAAVEDLEAHEAAGLTPADPDTGEPPSFLPPEPEDTFDLTVDDAVPAHPTDVRAGIGPTPDTRIVDPFINLSDVGLVCGIQPPNMSHCAPRAQAA